MTQQGAFTCVVGIKAERVADLRALLERVGAVAHQQDGPLPLARMTTVHFMRWVILGELSGPDGGPGLPPSLVLSTNYDDPLDAHLQDLVTVTGSTFDEIYQCCEGYAATKDADRVRFLKDHSLPYAAFYVGTRGRGVGQILRETTLREEIQAHLDQAKLGESPAAEIYASLRKKFTTGDYAWVLEPDGVPPAGLPLHTILRAVVAGASLALGTWLLCWAGVGLAWWLVLVVPIGLAAAATLLILFLLVVRSYEKWERVPTVKLAGASVDDLVKREDQVVQNQLSNVVFIKPTLFRRVTVRVVLFAIDLLGRLVFVRGALGGIPSIHFARWVVVDRGRRLLFMSNFDGSWENYLGDFIDKANFGLTGIWSNTIGCPPSRFLVFDGAKDERRFKDWVRENQLVTQVWYSAYPDLSVENVNNNTRIRQGLRDELSAKAAKQWLALL